MTNRTQDMVYCFGCKQHILCRDVDRGLNRHDCPADEDRGEAYFTGSVPDPDPEFREVAR